MASALPDQDERDRPTISPMLEPRSESASHESKERLGLALDAAQMGILEWSPREGLVQWSSRFHEVVGVSAETFADGNVESFNRLVHPDDRNRLWECTHHAFETRARFDCEFRMILPDGRVLWVTNFGRPIIESHGGRLAAASNNIDNGMTFEFVLPRAANRDLRQVARASPEFASPRC
jgi:PAS domain S-box-containing protein